MASDNTNATVDPVSGGDPLGQSSANLTPAKPGGEWDDPSTADDQLSALENEAWQQDPDAHDQQLANVEEEVPSETPEVEQPTPVETVEAEPDEVPQDATPRAQQRIRETIAARKAAEERAERLERAMAELVAAQSRSASFQEKLYADQAARLEAEKTKQSEASLLAKFKALGLKEDSLSDWLAFESMQKAEAAERKLAELERAERERQQQARYERYESDLRKELVAQAKRLGVPDEFHEDLFEQAYSLARAKQLQKPAEAVAKVLRPLTQSAKKPAPTKRPDPKDPVHNVISTRGRAAERNVVDSSKKKLDVEEIERSWGAGRLW